MAVAPALRAGNLVRWRNGPSGNIGVVAEDDSGRVRVAFDDGESLMFAAPYAAIERVTFEPGSPVRLISEEASGVVLEVGALDGVAVYQVQPARRRGQDSYGERRPARHNHRPSRPVATRGRARHSFDQSEGRGYSALVRPSVRRAVLAVELARRDQAASGGRRPPRRDDLPHRFLLADEVGLGKTIEAGLIIKELKARGVAKRVLVLAPSGIVASGSTS